ncbi:MAG: Rieske (2Fe-2S) protein [Flavobacteriales bacterium]|nr:Rieske (2Fe-2S) protein [Flavobacteriales bacterium]
MERCDFIRLCGMATGAALTGVFTAGCHGAARLQAAAVDGMVQLPWSAFGPDPKAPARSIVVEVEGLPAPIVVFHNGDAGPIALLMRCTHRGAELHLAGDRLDCPAHGSTFTAQGAVIEGPADRPLQRYPVERTDTGFVIRIA